jgi:protein SCO1/2
LKQKLWLAFIFVLMAPLAGAYDPKEVLVTGHELPTELQNVGIKEQHLGERLDLSLPFVSDTGEAVTLGQYFKKDRPVLMAMVYYTCPALCNYHLNALTEAMKQLKWTAGSEFEVVAVSMNHREGPDVAAKKKANYLKEYGRLQAVNGWHFLTGSEENVKKLAAQLGFTFRWLPEKEQYAHASVAYVVTPGGKISRYIYGLNVDEKTLRLSLLEASNGKIGTIIDQVMMFCFQFDPQKSKYTLYAWNLVRIMAILMVVLLATLLIPMWMRENKNRT